MNTEGIPAEVNNDKFTLKQTICVATRFDYISQTQNAFFYLHSKIKINIQREKKVKTLCANVRAKTFSVNVALT